MISSVSMGANAPAVDVLDIDAIPAEFVEVRMVTTTHADKRKIKDALAAGAQIPGVRLTETLSLLRK